MYKQIDVKGYFRKDGTWVGKHTRRIKVSTNKNIATSRISKNKNPNQLSFNFE
tara:strand:- start:100 stop:258 length:159 start_codon:yes stop_codon:yes gene_type:complete